MVHLANDLGSHISRCPTSVFSVIRLHLSRDTQISDSDIAALVKDQVFWFEVAVDDFAGVHILEAEDDTSDEESCLDFGEDAVFAKVVSHISSIAVIHDKVEIFPVLEGADHVD